MNDQVRKKPPLWVFRHGVQTREAYHLVQPEHSVKVNQNENPYEIPAPLKQKILDRFRDVQWSRYPPFVPDAFHELLARHYRVEPDQVIAGNGSNELLYATFITVLDPGDSIVLPVPTFTLYGILAGVQGAHIETVQMKSPFELDAQAVITKSREANAKLTVICTPNNPTAVAYPRQDIERILREVPGLVLLDLAYVEFADEDLTDLIAQHDNLIVLRTFSKALSLAGLRVGCAIGNPKLLQMVNKGKLPYALDAFSMTALEILLSSSEIFDGPIQTIREDRERLFQGMRSIEGIHPIPGQANFILARFDCGSMAAYQAFLDAGILVRNVSHYSGLEGHLRVSIGSSEETDAILEVCRNLSS